MRLIHKYKNVAMLKHGILFYSVVFLFNGIIAQNTTIKETSRTLTTYPFSDPNPIPILEDNAKIYPYFKYEGYSHESNQQDWKVIELENEFIKVFVLPEVGGKVWGAIDKTNGEEFIYRNEVMKFRNISMRGPWTSGGIEFNFGIIGHHPSTATPVDYVLNQHEDGSVSCTVGNIDLPSRTQWRVTIKVEPGKSAFETKAVWYNPTAMNQSYYNWMTAAAPARADFEFFTPGDELLKHSGEALPWPIDHMGRNLALYNENRFGPSKSYHVVGEYNDFFGGYYHDAKYGFGHWGEHEAIPGQKLWLWALSRAGGIWEDLLTDDDGQYIEFQAGRQFLQYSAGEHNNPQTQANFEPYATDQWTEVWFPVKEIGGLSDASDKAVLYVDQVENTVTINLHSFIHSEADIRIQVDGKDHDDYSVSLKPMDPHTHTFELDGTEDYSINIPLLDIHYSTTEDLSIDRPFHTEKLPSETVESMYRSAWESMKFRDYAVAKEKYKTVLESDDQHIPTLCDLAELCFRQANYQEGLTYANEALQLDTYHPRANYVTAILHRASGDYLNAKEAFGWAARSMTYRSNANCQIAEILLAENDLQKTKEYASKALDYNKYNVNAWKVMVVSERLTGDKESATEALNHLVAIDPINHFAHYERYLLNPSDEAKRNFDHSHQSELTYQTFLELAIDYYNLNQLPTAIDILKAAPNHALIDIWLAYLLKDSKNDVVLKQQSPEFVFPYRRETLHALEWLDKHQNHWTTDYYYALNLIAKDRMGEAADILQSLHPNNPHASFYHTRAFVLDELYQTNPLSDLKKARDVSPDSWRTWKKLLDHQIEHKNWTDGLLTAREAYRAFPENYSIGMALANLLNQNNRYEESINVLNNLKVLPFEGASESRKLYESAHYWHALQLIESNEYEKAMTVLEKSKEWPETLGVGKPYDADDRIANYMIGYIQAEKGNHSEATAAWKEVIQYTEKHIALLNPTVLLGLEAEQRVLGSEAAKSKFQTILQLHKGNKITSWLAEQFLDQRALNKNTSGSDTDRVSLIERITYLD
jgi:tetratricopeptide (TPR) repeat protein